MKLHANAQTCPRCRFLIVSMVMNGQRTASVALDFQVSTKTISKWVARFRAEGLVGLDVNTGAVRWSRPFPGSIGQSSPLALPGGQVAYAVGGLTVLDAATGRVMWHQPGTETFGRIAYDHGSILVEAVTAQTAALVAVDAATGKLEWAEPFGPQVALGPATGDGAVLISESNNFEVIF